MVQTDDASGEGIRALRCRAPQDMPQARHPKSAARLVGQEGGRQAVQQTPLPAADAEGPDRATIAAGEIRIEPDLIAAARDNARVLASSADLEGDRPAHPLIERTIAKLRKVKPSADNGLAAVNSAGLIRISAAPASIDRVELALNRIASAGEAIGIRLVKGDKGVHFNCEGEEIGFAVSEAVRREKHVLTEKELAQDEAARRRREKRWNSPASWRDDDFAFSYLRRPEWDYHPTGRLAIELEQFYLLGGSPRRSFKDAKIQRIENMAADIAVGIAVLAAAKKDDRIKRDEQARIREEDPKAIGRALQGRSIRPLNDEDFAAIVCAGFRQTLAPGNRRRLGLDLVDASTTLDFLEGPAISPRLERVLSSRIVRDAAFRRMVLDAYEDTCAATGLRIVNGGGRAEAQAAHIMPVEEGGPDAIQNGIAL